VFSFFRSRGSEYLLQLRREVQSAGTAALLKT
jgi:hypothetical protein